MFKFTAVKVVLYVVMASFISAITSTPFVVGLVALGIILALSSHVFCYLSRDKFFWGYPGYLHGKVVLALLRLVWPDVGWYLFTSAGFNPINTITGPYSSYYPIQLRVNNARSMASMGAYGKFLTKKPVGAQKPNDDWYRVGLY